MEELKKALYLSKQSGHEGTQVAEPREPRGRGGNWRFGNRFQGLNPVLGTDGSPGFSVQQGSGGGACNPLPSAGAWEESCFGV